MQCSYQTQYQTMKWVLELSIPSSIISDSNWENLKHIEFQPNLPICLYKRVYHVNKKTYRKKKRRFLKDFIKQPVTKSSPTFSNFSILIDCCMSAFSFLIKTFLKSEKCIKFHHQAFIICKNGENLKILMEIFCENFNNCNVVLAFLDHLKPKTFFIDQPWWLAEYTHFSETLDPRPDADGL